MDTTMTPDCTTKVDPLPVKASAICQEGFTLIELMFAVTVLGIGMLAGIILLLMGMQSNTRNKADTTATVLDQEIIELYSTLKTYPQPTTVSIADCAAGANNIHLADLGQGAAPAGNGAVLYTAGSAPSSAQIGDIDWTQPAPTMATSTTPGYAMQYQTCSGDIYEVRWNVMNLTPAAPPSGSRGRLSLLTVSSRQRIAMAARTQGAANQAVLFSLPITLRTMIED